MCKVYAICNQKGGCSKTSVTVNLGIGLAAADKRVAVIDADPQGSLTIILGYPDPDELPVTLATIMTNIIEENDLPENYGMLHHQEGIELILGLTEHAPGIPGTTDPFYYMNFEVVPRQLYGVEILHGSEINVLNDGTLSLEERFIRKLDYAIVGIHSLCYQDAGKEQNTENVISCMKHPKVKFVSHPDDDHTPFHYERLVRGAMETGTALEVNNSSLVKKDRRINCYENYRHMLQWCRKLDVPVIVSSDAHDPSWVGRVDLAMELLDDVAFPESLVLNLESGRLLEFLL